MDLVAPKPRAGANKSVTKQGNRIDGGQGSVRVPISAQQGAEPAQPASHLDNRSQPRGDDSAAVTQWPIRMDTPQPRETRQDHAVTDMCINAQMRNLGL